MSDKFLYDLQYRRNLHLGYMLFTSWGVLHMITYLFMIFFTDSSVLIFLWILIGYVYIYQYRFSFKVKDKETLWVFSTIKDFLEDKSKKEKNNNA